MLTILHAGCLGLFLIIFEFTAEVNVTVHESEKITKNWVFFRFQGRSKSSMLVFLESPINSACYR